MATDLTQKQASDSTKIVGSDSNGLETGFIANEGDAIKVHQVGFSNSAVTTVASATSATTVLSANTSRKSAIIHNSANASMYLKFGTGASTASFTVKIPRDAYFELPSPVYNGILTAVWDSAAGNVMVTEVT